MVCESSHAAARELVSYLAYSINRYEMSTLSIMERLLT